MGASLESGASATARWVLACQILEGIYEGSEILRADMSGVYEVDVAERLGALTAIKSQKRKAREYVNVADSGAKRVHAFCATCGSPIYSCAVDNRHTYSLRLGALSQKEALGRPARQIWTKRRLSWIPKLEGVPDIEGQR